jgi:hypothetical protein
MGILRARVNFAGFQDAVARRNFVHLFTGDRVTRSRWADIWATMHDHIINLVLRSTQLEVEKETKLMTDLEVAKENLETIQPLAMDARSGGARGFSDFNTLEVAGGARRSFLITQCKGGRRRAACSLVGWGRPAPEIPQDAAWKQSRPQRPAYGILAIGRMVRFFQYYRATDKIRGCRPGNGLGAMSQRQRQGVLSAQAGGCLGPEYPKTDPQQSLTPLTSCTHVLPLLLRASFGHQHGIALLHFHRSSKRKTAKRPVCLDQHRK